MSGVGEEKLFLDPEIFFVHFQDNNETAVILNYDDSSTVYYRLTNFGAQVVLYLTTHPNCSRSELHAHLHSLYEGSSSDVDTELGKVLDKLREHEIL